MTAIRRLAFRIAKPDSLDKTKAHYAAIFSRFTADVGAGAPAFERDCLAFELSQIVGLPESALVLDAGW